MKRITDEERVIAFFSEASAEQIEMMFNIVRGIVKKRQAAKQKIGEIPAEAGTKDGRVTSKKPAAE